MCSVKQWILSVIEVQAWYGIIFSVLATALTFSSDEGSHLVYWGTGVQKGKRAPHVGAHLISPPEDLGTWSSSRWEQSNKNSFDILFYTDKRTCRFFM
jgi:hypothetical protein